MKNRTLSLLAALIVGTGMLLWGSTAHAQNTPSSPSSSQDQQQTPAPPQPSQSPSSQQPSTQQPSTPQPPDQTNRSAQPPAQGSTPASAGAAQEFVGTVQKSGDKYVLKDDSGKTYEVDAQDQMKKFDGKRIRVKGTLDETGTKITVK